MASRLRQIGYRGIAPFTGYPFMNPLSVRAVFTRTFSAVAMAAVAAVAVLTACTPLQVVTHSVSQTEARVPTGQYTLDPHHWSVIFDVDHLKYSRFTVRFDRVDAQLDWNQGGLDKSQVTVAIDANSVDTNVPILDRLVKGADMFDAANHPQIRFVSTRFER